MWVRIYLCFLEHKSSDSDQGKITENKMITFTVLGVNVSQLTGSSSGFIDPQVL